MSRIDSPTNPRVVAAVKTLARGERMSLEGARLLHEALDAGVVPDEVYFAADEENAAAVRRAAGLGAKTFEASARVVEKLSDLSSSRGLVAVAPLPRLTGLEASLARNDLAVVLDGVQDPVNVGAIVRSAEAFGARAVLLARGSASPFSARALRASAGSAFRVPIATGVSVDDVRAFASRYGAALVGAVAHGGASPSSHRVKGPIVLVIGSEGHGLSAVLDSALTARVTLPLRGRVESLNAAVAAALLLYELSREPA